MPELNVLDIHHDLNPLVSQAAVDRVGVAEYAERREAHHVHAGIIVGDVN